MQLTGIREGDVVKVDDGLPYFALVEAREPRRLFVRPLCGHFNPKPVKAGDVVAHWRQARRRA